MFKRINSMEAVDGGEVAVRVLPRQYLEYRSGDYLAVVNYRFDGKIRIFSSSIILSDSSMVVEDVMKQIKSAAEVIFESPVVCE